MAKPYGQLVKVNGCNKHIRQMGTKDDIRAFCILSHIDNVEVHVWGLVPAIREEETLT